MLDGPRDGERGATRRICNVLRDRFERSSARTKPNPAVAWVNGDSNGLTSVQAFAGPTYALGNRSPLLDYQSVPFSSN